MLVHGEPLDGPNAQVAIVFQSFALFPWLTVLDNVELGLLATDLSPAERRARAEQAIDLIGLAGYEEAFPKELSGGMKQRVGFARALVVHPEVLFMDEPFSALDVLTGENLRQELQDLWAEHSIPTRAVLIVTHNIEEAVALADRILVFGANPGHIRVELKGLPQADRRAKNSAHAQLVETIYQIMTNPELDAAELVQQRSMTARGAEPKTRGVARPAVPDAAGCEHRRSDGLRAVSRRRSAAAATCTSCPATSRCAPTTSWHSSRRPTCWVSRISRTAR